VPYVRDLQDSTFRILSSHLIWRSLQRQLEGILLSCLACFELMKVYPKSLIQRVNATAFSKCKHNVRGGSHLQWKASQRSVLVLSLWKTCSIEIVP